MSKSTDIGVIETALFFLPVRTRVPLKFGAETLTEVLCARVRVRVIDRRGQTAEGWGETPLSAQWVWPSALPLAQRTEGLRNFCHELARAWAGFAGQGHPMEIGHDFQEQVLPGLLLQANAARGGGMSSRCRGSLRSFVVPRLISRCMTHSRGCFKGRFIQPTAENS